MHPPPEKERIQVRKYFSFNKKKATLISDSVSFLYLYKTIQIKSHFKLSMSMIQLLTDSSWCMRNTCDLFYIF